MDAMGYIYHMYHIVDLICVWTHDMVGRNMYHLYAVNINVKLAIFNVSIFGHVSSGPLPETAVL